MNEITRQKFKLPELAENQEWCCANGCGPCGIKLVPVEFYSSTNLVTGETDKKFEPVQLSACCGAQVELGDSNERAFLNFERLPA